MNGRRGYVKNRASAHPEEWVGLLEGGDFRMDAADRRDLVVLFAWSCHRVGRNWNAAQSASGPGRDTSIDRQKSRFVVGQAHHKWRVDVLERLALWFHNVSLASREGNYGQVQQPVRSLEACLRKRRIELSGEFDRCQSVGDGAVLNA